MLVKILLILEIAAIFVASVSAWDDTGHKLKAYIAWEQMSPQAREKAIKILLSAPEDSDLSVFYLQDSRSAAAKQRELNGKVELVTELEPDKENADMLKITPNNLGK